MPGASAVLYFGISKLKEFKVQRFVDITPDEGLSDEHNTAGAGASDESGGTVQS
jgi:hypothetical protein